MEKKYNIGWGFTKACNLRCKHCYNDSGGKRGKDELTLEEAIEVVDKLKDLGVKTINYGTGESGLVRDFWKLVEYANSRDIVQGFTTGGWSVNEQSIDKVKKYLNDVDVSIDYANEKEHNEFRGSDKAWSQAINALDLLKENDVEFGIVACITAKNCHQENLDGLLELSKKYDCDLRVNWFRPTGRGKSASDLKLSVEQVNETFIYLLENSVATAIPDPYFAALLGINKREGCPCGKDSFRVTPNGSVVPCVYFTKEMTAPNVLENDFENILTSEPFEAINNRGLDFCSDCEHMKNCRGGCASRAYLESGSMDEPDAFCYKKAGLTENPFKDVEFSYQPQGVKVHDNYLCTIILKAK
ncbi:radical SAM/SPASM domain-containing protein [Thermoproteota archaeon]